MTKALMITLMVVILGVVLQPMTALASSEEDVLELMNDARSEAGLGAVTMDDSLSSIAQIRAAECAASFSHTRPDGKQWSTVSVETNGENLAHAVNSNQSKPENVVLAWMLSPGHRANVLKANCTSVGIAYFYSETGDTYIVCEFN